MYIHKDINILHIYFRVNYSVFPKYLWFSHILPSSHLVPSKLNLINVSLQAGYWNKSFSWIKKYLLQWWGVILCVPTTRIMCCQPKIMNEKRRLSWAPFVSGTSLLHEVTHHLGKFDRGDSSPFPQMWPSLLLDVTISSSHRLQAMESALMPFSQLSD